MELPKVNYYVSDLQDKYNNGLLKDHLDAIQYIQQYYYESSNGMYYFYDAEKMTLNSKQIKILEKKY